MHIFLWYRCTIHMSQVINIIEMKCTIFLLKCACLYFDFTVTQKMNDETNIQYLTYLPTVLPAILDTFKSILLNIFFFFLSMNVCIIAKIERAYLYMIHMYRIYAWIILHILCTLTFQKYILWYIPTYNWIADKYVCVRGELVCRGIIFYTHYIIFLLATLCVIKLR